MGCSSCGAQVAAGTRLCPSCGATFGVAPRTSSFAVVSLAAGIAAYLGFTFPAALVAIVAGHLARKEIRASGGQTAGGGLALAGLILGYVHFALLFAIFVIVSLAFRNGFITGALVGVNPFAW